MTSLDFQSLLQKEKALRRAELKEQHAPPNEKADSLEASKDRQGAEEVAEAPRADDRTETSPWLVELAARPLLEMDKARVLEINIWIVFVPCSPRTFT